MTKTEAKIKAKDIIQETLAVAYYKLENEPDLPLEEVELITHYINKYGTACCKAIGVDYYTM